MVRRVITPHPIIRVLTPKSSGVMAFCTKQSDDLLFKIAQVACGTLGNCVAINDTPMDYSVSNYSS